MLQSLVLAFLLAAPESDRIQAREDQALMLVAGGKIGLGPKYLRKPSLEQFRNASTGLVQTGGATEYTVQLMCVAEKDGSLTLCETAGETPKGSKVADVALSLSEFYAVAPMLPDGASSEGRVIIIPLGFRVRASPPVNP